MTAAATALPNRPPRWRRPLGWAVGVVAAVALAGLLAPLDLAHPAPAHDVFGQSVSAAEADRLRDNPGGHPFSVPPADQGAVIAYLLAFPGDRP